MITQLPILVLLIVAVAVAVASRQFRVPFNVALVVAGMVLSRFDWSATLGPDWRAFFYLRPDIILGVFLPALLFQAALETNLSELRANMAVISGLALVGTFGAVAIIGAILTPTVFGGYPGALLLALLVGAILSTTDTISVLMAFKAVRVPQRLAVIIEGESLFNDGAALVAFGILTGLLASAGTGSGSPAPHDPALESAAPTSLAALFLQTVKVVAGGAIIGVFLGFIAGQVCRQISDSLTCLMLTTVVAYGSHLAGELLAVSGVIATVSAGLTFRSVVWTSELSPGSRLAMLSFWEFASFLVNSLVFLLLGFQIELADMWNHIVPIGWTLLAIHVSRVMTVYPMMQVSRWWGQPVPLRYQHVMVAGNIKGAISASMALLVTADLVADEPRGLIQSVTLGAVLITLLTQGLTLPSVLRGLGLGQLSSREREFQLHQIRLLAARSALRELDRLHDNGLITNLNYRHLRSRYQLGVAEAERGLQQLANCSELYETARRMIVMQRHLITVEKTAILEAVRDKVVSDEVAAPLLNKLDEEMLAKGRYLDE